MRRAILFATAILGLAQGAAALGALPPDLDPARMVIAQQCKLAAWQYALTANPDNTVRVELSPTLSHTSLVCLYQVLSNFRVPLEKPVPVQVVKEIVEKPKMIF